MAWRNDKGSLVSAPLRARVPPLHADAGAMLYRFVLLIALSAGSACLLAAAAPAQAHPHVWVTMTEELLYAPDGSVTGVRHAWSFDEMFSAFAIQGLESKSPGVFTREELGPLARSMSNRSRSTPTSPTPRSTASGSGMRSSSRSTISSTTIRSRRC